MENGGKLSARQFSSVFISEAKFRSAVRSGADTEQAEIEGVFRCGFQLCSKVTALLLRGDIALRQELVIGIHDRTHTDLVVCSQLSFGRQLSIYRQVFEIGAKNRKQ